jgi:hypothetical protein
MYFGSKSTYGWDVKIIGYRDSEAPLGKYSIIGENLKRPAIEN